jgi:hypothetical protein
MSTEEPEAKRDEAKPRERRRLKLIESYGAFSDDRLQEVAQKIRGITSDNDTQPTAPQGEVPLSTGEITESITQWITQCPLGETEGVKGNQDLENAKHITRCPFRKSLLSLLSGQDWGLRSFSNNTHRCFT